MLLISSCDTGSANFLAPVLSTITVKFVLYAQKDAAIIFKKWNIPFKLLEAVDWDDLLLFGEGIISKQRYIKAIITGTSWGATVDKALTLAAKNNNLPCVSIIEHWDLYMERFSRVEDGYIMDVGKFLPDRIWVNDSVAYSDAGSAGVPKDMIEVVGQPHLEYQTELLKTHKKTEQDKQIVFISERVAGDFVIGSPLSRGFDEYTVLELLIGSIDFTNTNLLIKLHPQESLGKFDSLICGMPNISAVKEASNMDIITNSWKIVGMFSMLLLEAALIRDDVISFLPGGNPLVFVGNKLGATIPVTTQKELKKLLLEKKNKPHCKELRTTLFAEKFLGSGERIADLILRLTV